MITFPTPQPLPSQLLLSACLHGSATDVFDLLKKDRTLIKERDGHGLGPVITATIAKRADILDVLMDYGANLEEADENGTTALAFAISLGYDDIVTMLVERGASPTKSNVKPPIRGAAVSGRIELAAYLIFLGADLFELHDGNAPIEAAVMTDRLEFVQWALSLDLERVKADEMLSRRIIDIGVRSGAVEILKWLTETQIIPIDLRAYLGPVGSETAVQLASYHGGYELLKWMLEDLHMSVESNNSKLRPLLLAAHKGRRRCVDLLLQHAKQNGLDIIDETSDNGETALMHAAMIKDSILVKLLLEAGANVNIQSKIRATALQIASGLGDLQTVKLLVDAGADLTLINLEDNFPLYAAINGGFEETASYLYDLPSSASMILKRPPNAPNLLVLAAQKGLKLSLRIAADHPELMFKHGPSVVDSILSQCFIHGHLELGLSFLDLGYSISQHCNLKTLNLATANGHLEVLKYLFKHGSEAIFGEHLTRALSASSPITMLLSVACSNGRLEIVKYLVEEENVPVGRYSGATDPIFFACSFGHAAVAKYLHSKGSSLEFYDERGHLNLLHAACRQGSLEIVDFLLSQSSTSSSFVNAIGSDNMTPLLFAASKGHVDVFKRLLEAGASIKAVDHHQRNAVAHAARVGKVEILKICHERGVSFSVENTRELGPAQVAVLHGHIDATDFILDTALPHFLNDAGHVSHLIDMAIMSGRLSIVQHIVEKRRLPVLLGLPCPPPSSSAKNVHDVSPLSPESLTVSIRMPLAVRCTKFGRSEILEWLYLNGWIPSLTTRCGSYNTPLAHACYSGQLAIVKVLHKLGVDLHSFGSEEPPSLNERTPLAYAYTSGSIPLIKWMLSKGCDFNSTGPTKRTTISQDPTPLNNFLRSISIPETT